MSASSAGYECPLGLRNSPYKRLSWRGLDCHSPAIGVGGSKEATAEGRRQPPENNHRPRRRHPHPTPTTGSSGVHGPSMHFAFRLAFVVVLIWIAGIASASPPMTTMKVVPILQREETRTKDGEFTLKYVTGDGIVLAEVGKLKSTADGGDVVLVKEGSYSYTSPEGKLVRLSYVADEMGFRPVAWNVAPPAHESSSNNNNPPEEKKQ
ncbi:larval cuticle protein 1-like [Ischnura elegans]|uniref:larval cuticle protein 1-like n=1 Tax=Ischnura elegans TaxID=197161 RepID=UPI001ED89E5C|nr:larval cuticle protein 1-like [Ischnura elegans]